MMVGMGMKIMDGRVTDVDGRGYLVLFGDLFLAVDLFWELWSRQLHAWENLLSFSIVTGLSFRVVGDVFVKFEVLEFFSLSMLFMLFMFFMILNLF